MKRFLYAFLFLVLSIKSYSQKAEFDTTKCVNYYEGDIKNAVKDTCLVSIGLGCSETKLKRCTISSQLAFVKNLYELVIKTNKTLKVENGNYKFQFLYSAFITGIITYRTFPKDFFSSHIIGNINLFYLNEIKRIPFEVMQRKRSSNFCALFLSGGRKYKNNSASFYQDLKFLVTSKKYNKIKLINCYFSLIQQKELQKLASPNDLVFDNEE